jgi:Holliday junction DNA helicase RuvA
VIGRLAGTVLSEELDGHVLLDVNGVGYELLAPVGTAARAAGATGAGKAVFYTHTHVREDALELYGFATELERRVFRLLIEVPNVGPKTALGVLSALPPPELARAVEARDLNRLNKISGVGKKTAERLVLELREKLPKIGSAGAGAPEPAHGDTERLVGALTNMGYRPAEAQRAVRSLGERIGQEPLAVLLKESLAELSR